MTTYYTLPEWLGSREVVIVPRPEGGTRLQVSGEPAELVAIPNTTPRKVSAVMARIARYCACGGALTGTARPDRLAYDMCIAFDTFHTKPGCSPATAMQSAAARRRADRKEANSRG